MFGSLAQLHRLSHIKNTVPKLYAIISANKMSSTGVRSSNCRRLEGKVAVVTASTEGYYYCCHYEHFIIPNKW